MLRLVSANIRARALNSISGAAPPGTIVEFREKQTDDREQNAEDVGHAQPTLQSAVNCADSVRTRSNGRPSSCKTLAGKIRGAADAQRQVMVSRQPVILENLSKGEMSELIESMLAWGVQNDVMFHDEAN